MSVGSWISSGLGPAANLARRIPGWVWLAAAGLLLGAFWLQQHDARIRQQAQLKQLHQQAAVQVAALKKQAQQDVRRADVENAKAIQKLQERRQQMEQQNRRLAAQLDALRNQSVIQADQVATLPIRDVVTRVAAQLGLKPEDVAPPAQATPHPAAGAATLSPGRGLDHASSADMAKNATSAPPEKTTAASRKGAKAQSKTSTPAALALTASGARKVESALVRLNACSAESKIENQQTANCQARVAAEDATIQRLNSSVASLNQALEAKDRILSQQESECKAELKAAKGSFLGRLAHVTEHVAIGVVVGVVVGVLIR